MRRKTFFSPSILILPILFLSSCIGLIPLNDEEPAASRYGPQLSLKEHQARTFEALWTVLQDNYIYYETAELDWDALRTQYQADIDRGLTAAEFDDLLRELEDDLPPSSILYQSRTERIETEITDNSTYEGIGAFIGFDAEPEPHIILLSIIEAAPAENSGLTPHDSILAIDGGPVLLTEGVNAVQRVRGLAGSTVTLTVRSPGGEERDVKVQRGRLATTVRLEAHRIAETNYGYLLFPPIAYEGMLEDVLTTMQVLTTDQTLGGLILDLRIAGSSGSWPLNELFTLFHDGAVGEFYNRTRREPVQVEGQDLFTSQSVPLVILVGKNTQGFPEILAGGLQMHERAVVIGETTNGRIESSTAYLLPDGSRVYIETTSFVLPNGEEIGFNGVQPDVEIEAGWDDVFLNNDPVIDAAIRQLRTK